MRPQIYLLVLFIMSGFFAFTCAHAPHVSKEPQKIILEKVPFIKQGNMECGPACMTMILNYYGINQTLHETTIGLEWTRAYGVPTWTMRAYPAKQHLQSQVYSWWNASLNRLIDTLRNGQPVIVRQWYDVAYKKKRYSGHYRVVIGFDLAKKRIYINDPLYKRDRLMFQTFETFIELWEMQDHPWPTTNWMLVVAPPAP